MGLLPPDQLVRLKGFAKVFRIAVQMTCENKLPTLSAASFALDGSS